MQKDDATPSRCVSTANDNDAASGPATIDAALTGIAEAIGRHIAREHIRTRKASNDNEAITENPRPPKR